MDAFTAGLSLLASAGDASEKFLFILPEELELSQ